MLDPSSTASPPDQLLQPPPKQKRSSVACRRCRRLRAKCVKEEKDGGLCRGCIDAGVPNECEFLPRGMSAIDRAPRPAQRRKRQRRDVSPDHINGTSSIDSLSESRWTSTTAYPPAIVNGICTCCQQRVPTSPVGASFTPAPPPSHADLLPPQEELIEGCEWFFTTYFQLGFLHKPTFMHTLLTAPSSISPFLLLSMLSVSARFTPSLIQRYGSPAEAAQVFAKRAQKFAGDELLGVATLERAQAFFLCSIWSWGSGYRDRSWIFLGVAARMVSILKLSQEDSYSLPPDASVEQVISAEVSRRTWWVIFMSDNLLSSGCGRPISFDLDKVTIPLPLDEDHFSFGYQGPTTVLPGTKAKGRPRSGSMTQSQTPFHPPQIDPQLQSRPESSTPVEGLGTGVGERSLYGNLVTIADIWARVARSALQRSKPPITASSALAPWHPESDYCKLVRELEVWEATLGSRQSWSMSNLLAYQSKNLDMGFRGIFLFMYLAHIVLRRSYLPMMAHDVQSGQASALRNVNVYPNATGVSQPQPPPPRFWETMVHDMFAHALKAIELVKSWIPTRPFSRGCTPMMGFSLFMAGSVLSYLRKWKWLCPSLYPYTEPAVQSALEMIADIAAVWPIMGNRWHTSLSKSFSESSFNNPFSPMTQRERGVEGLGRAAEEDLSVDDREGMYRHKSLEEIDEEDQRGKQQSPGPSADLDHTSSSNGIAPQGSRDVVQHSNADRHRSASVSSVSHIQSQPQTHDAHMLYSLAAAASMDQKMANNQGLGPSSGAGPSAPNGHAHHHVQSHSHGQQVSVPGMHDAQGPPAFIPQNAGEVPPGAAGMDWSNFHTDIAMLLQDDLNVHLEYGGDGWAF